MSSLSPLDWGIVLASLLSVFGVGLWSSWTHRHRPSSAHTNDDQFFLAARATPWYIIAASLFASNIGTEHFVGQAGTACAVGLSAANFEWTAAYFLIALGWVFAPLYISTKLVTVPQYLERRFSRECRLAMVSITLATYCLSKIAASLYAGSILLEVVAV